MRILATLAHIWHIFILTQGSRAQLLPSITKTGTRYRCLFVSFCSASVLVAEDVVYDYADDVIVALNVQV